MATVKAGLRFRPTRFARGPTRWGLCPQTPRIFEKRRSCLCGWEAMWSYITSLGCARLKHSTHLGLDNPRDQLTICKAKGQRQAHIDNAFQNSIAFGHRRARRIAPTVIATGEPLWLGPTKPLELDTARRTARKHVCDGRIRPVQQEKLDRRANIVLLLWPPDDCQTRCSADPSFNSTISRVPCLALAL